MNRSLTVNKRLMTLTIWVMTQVTLRGKREKRKWNNNWRMKNLMSLKMELTAHNPKKLDRILLLWEFIRNMKTSQLFLATITNMKNIYEKII